MPTVLRLKGYRFGFYASDANEPPHVKRMGNMRNFGCEARPSWSSMRGIARTS
jgi:hypothetical protein